MQAVDETKNSKQINHQIQKMRLFFRGPNVVNFVELRNDMTASLSDIGNVHET